MGKVICNISMSLDGIIAGPGISLQQPIGKNGERLHDWLFKDKTAVNTVIMDELVETTGAVILGNRNYVNAIEHAWSGVSPFTVPAFVVSNDLPASHAGGFAFVKDGIEQALEQAKAVAGEKNVWIMGGADIIRQYLKAALIDELHIHIVPVILGKGSQLFDTIRGEQIELKKIKVTDSPAATHIQYLVIK